jgi:hypothetical protein
MAVLQRIAAERTGARRARRSGPASKTRLSANTPGVDSVGAESIPRALKAKIAPACKRELVSAID